MPNAIHYFLYARKSTDVEDKQVRSIDAQLVELREIAKRHNLIIIEELIEKKSAKRTGRPIFNAMLGRIEVGEADGILAWHADRLARNSTDSGRIISLLDSGKLLCIQFHGTRVENTPQGKMMLNVEFGFSKYYVDTLSENTKRGLREKVRRGEFPSMAPIGYLNDYRTKRIIVDRERGPIVREVFERYASGNETLDTTREFFALKKVRTENNKLLSRASVGHILSNPIYYGHFNWSGEVWEGKHEPLVTKQLFDRVQALRSSRWKWSSKTHTVVTPKPFVQLLRCAECGCGISAETQKGHTYYRCTKKNRLRPRCLQPYIREEDLDHQISALLSPFALRPDWADQMLARLETEHAHATQTATALIGEKRREIEALTLRFQHLKNALLDGLFQHDEYRTEKAKIMSEKKTVEEQMAVLTNGSFAWLEPFKEWILAAQTLGIVAQQGLLTEKRGLAKKVFGSNLVLDRKKAGGKAVEPWSFIPENSGGILVVPVLGFEPVIPSLWHPRSRQGFGASLTRSHVAPQPCLLRRSSLRQRLRLAGTRRCRLTPCASGYRFTRGENG